MKKYQFKNPDTVLSTPFGRITNENITEEKYNRVLELNPVHADMFELKEVEESPLFIVPKKEKKEEPKVSKQNKPQPNE